MAGSRERDPQNTRITGWKIFSSATTREKNTFKRGRNLFWDLMEHARLPHTPHIRIPGNSIHHCFFLDSC